MKKSSSIDLYHLDWWNALLNYTWLFNETNDPYVKLRSDFNDGQVNIDIDSGCIVKKGFRNRCVSATKDAVCDVKLRLIECWCGTVKVRN